MHNRSLEEPLLLLIIRKSRVPIFLSILLLLLFVFLTFEVAVGFSIGANRLFGFEDYSCVVVRGPLLKRYVVLNEVLKQLLLFGVIELREVEFAH